MSEAVSGGAQLPLDTLGKQIKAHIDSGDKMLGKAEDHYKAAGIELIGAKERVKATPNLTWPKFLLHYCDIGRRRADELIAIAEGRTTIEDLREQKRESVKATRERKKESALRSAKSDEAVAVEVAEKLIADVSGGVVDAQLSAETAKEIETLKKRLAKAEEEAKENASLAKMREVRAREAEDLCGKVQTEAVYLRAEVAVLKEEILRLKEQLAEAEKQLLASGAATPAPANSNEPVSEPDEGPPVAFIAKDYKPTAPAEEFDLGNIPAHMDRRKKAA